MLSVIFFMDGPNADLSTSVVFGRLGRVKEPMRIQKALILGFFANTLFIRLTCSGPLKAWPHFMVPQEWYCRILHCAVFNVPVWGGLVQRRCRIP